MSGSRQLPMSLRAYLPFCTDPPNFGIQQIRIGIDPQLGERLFGGTPQRVVGAGWLFRSGTD
jgi:hypothetical protein